MKKDIVRCSLDVYLRSANKGSEILYLKLASDSESLHESTKSPLSALKENPVPQIDASERTLLLYGLTAEKFVK